MTSQHDSAWNDFWARNRHSGGNGGCLPAKWKGIDAAQQTMWHRFSQNLPKKAHIIDIATGDGRVLAWLMAKRRDLKPIGVDMAPELPEPPKGVKFRCGVSMEKLPFPDSKFAAATSQFGFEYGDLTAAAAELNRVVVKGGSIAIMTHRQDGPILAHNLKRRDQINWVLEEQELFEIAKRSLKLQASGALTSTPKLQQAPAEGARLFGETSAAWEIAEAIRRTMLMAGRAPPANIAQTLDMIRDQARNELGRIASLDSACMQTADEAAFVSAIAAGGLKQMSCTEVCETDLARPFADFRILAHA